MDRFLDELARVFASRIPRRQVLKRIWTVAAGTLLAGAVAGPASAVTSCKNDKDCPGNQQCCKKGPTGFCAPKTSTCCGDTACPPNQCCIKKSQICTASLEL